MSNAHARARAAVLSLLLDEDLITVDELATGRISTNDITAVKQGDKITYNVYRRTSGVTTCKQKQLFAIVEHSELSELDV